MARAARLSGADLDDDEFEEIEELIHEKKEHPEELVFFLRLNSLKDLYCDPVTLLVQIIDPFIIPVILHSSRTFVSGQI
jgi:hypothetical protein